MLSMAHMTQNTCLSKYIGYGGFCLFLCGGHYSSWGCSVLAFKGRAGWLVNFIKCQSYNLNSCMFYTMQGLGIATIRLDQQVGLICRLFIWLDQLWISNGTTVSTIEACYNYLAVELKNRPPKLPLSIQLAPSYNC